MLVRVAASSIAGDDWHLVRGLPRVARLGTGLTRPKRRIPGQDVAGRVEAIGEGVTAFEPGDEVFGWCDGGGAFAEFASVPGDALGRGRPYPRPTLASVGTVSTWTAAWKAVPRRGTRGWPIQVLEDGLAPASMFVAIRGTSPTSWRSEMRTILTLGAAALAACSASGAGFTGDDEAAVRALEEAYRTAWLANDSTAVMATLSPDAVLMPSGVEPLAGDSAIRAFWWPADGSETTVTSYEIAIDEVEGSRGLAFLRGRGSLEFTYRSPFDEVTTHSSEAVHLSLARRGADGQWRIARRAWSSLR